MLAERNFRRLITASGASNVADGALQTVLPIVALTVTREPAAFAAVLLVGRLPWLLIALPAGAVADRLDRRLTMVRVNLGRTTVIGALAVVVASGHQELWMLYVVAFTMGVAETFYDTSAQSILPSIVAAPDLLERANGRLYAVELTANQFVGPALGGLVAGASLAGGLTATAAAYLVAGGVVITILGTFRAQRSAPTRLRRDIVAGVRYLAQHPLLRALAVCVGVSNLASSAMFAIFPLYAIAPGPIGLTPAAYGLLLAAVAAGSIIGSQLVTPLTTLLGPRRSLLVAMIAAPGFSLAPALTTDPWWIAAVFVASAAISVSWNIITVSLRQRIVPDELLGRINASYRLVAWGTMPIGAGLGGLIADRYGLVTVFWTSAAISALCVPIVLFQVTTTRLAKHTARTPTLTSDDSGRR